jgi:hypothetical protein
VSRALENAQRGLEAWRSVVEMQDYRTLAEALRAVG